jgi:hypothetical protein
MIAMTTSSSIKVKAVRRQNTVCEDPLVFICLNSLAKLRFGYLFAVVFGHNIDQLRLSGLG